MPSQVIFHELDASVDDAAAILSLAIALIEQGFDAKRYTTVVCADKAQAEAIDELLWQNPADRFIPHALYGEGDDKPVPVEIIWEQALSSGGKIRNRRLIVNMSMEMIENFHQIECIHDFVPSDTTEKANARARYANYKNAQCNMSFNKAKSN